MQDLKLHIRTALAAHLGNDFVQRHVHGELAVHRHDDVAGAQAGPVARCIFDGAHHEHLIVLHGDLDAHAEELAAGALLHFLKFLFGHQGGMGVEVFEHALERPVEQFLMRNFLDVVLLHHVEYLAEAAKRLVIGLGAYRLHHAATGKKRNQSEGSRGQHTNLFHKKASENRMEPLNDRADSRKRQWISSRSFISGGSFPPPEGGASAPALPRSPSGFRPHR